MSEESKGAPASMGSGLSNFIRNATSEEKGRVFGEVMRKATEQQIAALAGAAPTPQPELTWPEPVGWHIRHANGDEEITGWPDPKATKVQGCYTAEQVRAMLGAAPTPQPGWKLVPVEPTREMIEDGWLAIEADEALMADATRCYLAMLGAAPTQAPQQPVVSVSPPGAGVLKDAALKQAREALVLVRSVYGLARDSKRVIDALAAIDKAMQEDGADLDHLAAPCGPRTSVEGAYCGRCDRGPKQALNCPHGERCGRPDVSGVPPSDGQTKSNV